MREPPKLADGAIIEALRAHYALAVTALTFLPLGADSGSAVYRAEGADGNTYLVKVRAGWGFSEPSLAVPRYLHDQGVPHLVVPLATVEQALWVPVEDFALGLYPFLTGQTAKSVGLAAPQWQELGATVREIHTAYLPPALRQTIPRETFVPSRRSVMDDLDVAVDRDAPSSLAGRELAAFWRAQRALIRQVVRRSDTLADELRQAAPPLPWVLCHADLHTNNILVDHERQWWLLDWDEIILAPKERDLMFVIRGIRDGYVSADETACFLRGYGEPVVDARALTYYRYAWAVQDLAAYGERILFTPDISEAVAPRRARALPEPVRSGRDHLDRAGVGGRDGIATRYTEESMRFAGWYGVVVGLLMAGQWGFFLATGNVPELKTAPIELAFHLAAEFVTAVALFVSSAALLRRARWARATYAVASGMLIYSVIVSPGYFAQQGQWPLVLMFAVLLLLTLTSLVGLAREAR